MKVLIADKFESWGLDALRKLGCDVIYEPGTQGQALIARVRDSECEALVVRSTKVTRQTLEAAPALKLVIRAGSGYDTIDVAAASERGVRVCNCPGMNAVAVAELTLGLMIALDRRIVDETADLRRGVWNKKEYSKARGLKGRTMGIVGLGRVGWEVAKRAAAFEMNLTYADVVAKPDLEQQLGIRRQELGELLAEADFVTLHVTGDAENHHLIGKDQLALMRPTAFLINCSRGDVVDEQALAVALEAGALAGAALDVYEREPAVTDEHFSDPISHAPRLYGTHHVGASTEQAQHAVAEETVRIVQTFLESGAFVNCVNPPVPSAAPP